MNTENSKTNGPHKLIINLSQRLELEKFKETCYLSKVIYLLHVEKYNETV